jgi:PAS domain S-box-containing protein
VIVLKENISWVSDLELGDHLCIIYETEEEHIDVFTSFIRDGFKQNQQVVYIIDSHTVDEILNYLNYAGLDGDYYIDIGQLEIISSKESYLKEGIFEPDKMIELLREKTEKALKNGLKGLRVTGEMSWAIENLDNSDKLIEYEAKLNRFFASNNCLAICQYDKIRFSPEILLNILRTHPLAVIGTELYNNIYYINPDELLGKDPKKAELERWIGNLVQRNRLEEHLEEIIKKRTRKLRESEKRFRDIAEFSFDVITTIDSQGVIQYISPSVKDILGFKPEQLVGRNFQEIIPVSDDIEKELERIDNVFASLEKGESIQGFQLEFLSKISSPVIAEINATPVMEEGKMVKVEAVVRDITERVESRRLLEQQNRQLKRLNKMKDEFIAKATHELRTPLTALKGYMDYIKNIYSEELSERVKELINIIDRNINRLNTLINVLLEQQRITSSKVSLKKEPIELSRLAHKVSEEIQPIFSEKNQNLKVVAPDNISMLHADRAKISQVLLNLLSNASNYSPKDSNIILKIIEAEDTIKVKIKDEGIGISQKNIDMLFEPFTEINKPEGYSSGTGLGLSICKGIIELHGGKIWAKSKGKDMGSTFTFSLPQD